MQGSADIPGNVVVEQTSRPYRNNFRLHQPSASAVAVIGCVAFDCNPSRHSTPVFDTSRRSSQGSLHTALFSVALQQSIRIRPFLHRLRRQFAREEGRQRSTPTSSFRLF
ncbi:hypothetical protein L1887_54194 [Cichorium endivia]|nr:hypothetical protein L1887_54194 [Cichorium endivia]